MNTKKSETIRSFLAIEIDDKLSSKILKIQDSFKKTNSNIKYVSSENMHITLKFFGAVDEYKLKEIELAINNVIEKHSSFELTIEGCGNFPTPNLIKVIWIGITKNKELINLQKDLDTEFKKIGFKKDKNFISHLTIGRIKNQKNKDKIKKVIKDNENIKIGKMRVSKLYLKKSTLTPKGPIYKNIKTFNLD